MFDKTAEKLATMMGRSVKKAAEPIKTGAKQIVNNRVDLYSRILRLAVLVLLFIDGTRRVSDIRQGDSSPTQITINNYMSDKGR